MFTLPALRSERPNQKEKNKKRLFPFPGNLERKAKKHN
jgi:hypothetical protein